MKRTWIGVFVIALLVGGVLLAKSMKSQPPGPVASGTPSATTSQAPPQVILFGDPAEAEETCGCAEVFQAVRAASTKGVRTREVDPLHEKELVRQYRVTVEPTVVFVDATGREVSRREGESRTTISALRADLDQLVGGRR